MTALWPEESEPARDIFNGIARMFAVRAPEQLHTGRDVRDDCPAYNALQPVAVWQIDNSSLRELYHAHKEVLRSRLSNCRFPAEETRLDAFARAMDINLDESINERLLLHGTKPEHVRHILAEGLNERLCVGIFGKGVYLAEDVEKIDQYTGPDEELQIEGELRELHAQLYRDTGVAHAGSLYYAFVCRTTLGCAVHSEDGFKSLSGDQIFEGGPRGPRAELARVPDEYLKADADVVRHNSLVVELGHTIRRFREFVVCHGVQVLPEFLVAYHRTNCGKPVGEGYARINKPAASDASDSSSKSPGVVSEPKRRWPCWSARAPDVARAHRRDATSIVRPLFVDESLEALLSTPWHSPSFSGYSSKKVDWRALEAFPNSLRARTPPRSARPSTGSRSTRDLAVLDESSQIGKSSRAPEPILKESTNEEPSIAAVVFKTGSVSRRAKWLDRCKPPLSGRGVGLEHLAWGLCSTGNAGPTSYYDASILRLAFDWEHKHDGSAGC